ncbi:MAG: sensor histidine kinase [Gemmatimonadaceae bacterium]
MNLAADLFPHSLDWFLRIVLPALGPVAVLIMAVVLRRERRQAASNAERSRELERLSSELIRSNRMKSEFLANVSHELRTPLNAIVGFIDLLREGVYGELTPRQSVPVERIEASANHLRILVDQVLDLAKIAAGKLDVQMETIALRPFLMNVATELESLTNEKALSLSLTLGAALPPVRADPTHLRQILINLIGNACKYTDSGVIAVRAATGDETNSPRLRMSEVGRWLCISVTDSGPGIPLADQQRIFEEFEQVDAGSRTHSERRGTGLGLPISRRLAEAMGGDVTLESEPGKGATFSLWLPLEGRD